MAAMPMSRSGRKLKTLIRCCILWHLSWDCTVYICPHDRFPEKRVNSSFTVKANFQRLLKCTGTPLYFSSTGYSSYAFLALGKPLCFSSLGCTSLFFKHWVHLYVFQHWVHLYIFLTLGTPLCFSSTGYTYMFF